MFDLKTVDVKNLTPRQVYIALCGLTFLSFLLIYFGLVRKLGVTFQGDSTSYLFFHQTRPVGYPIFLWLIRQATGGVAAVPVVQTLALQLGYAWLCAALYRLIGRPLIVLATFVALSALCLIFRMQSEISTETLTAALLCVWAAQVLLFLRQPDWGGYALVCAAGTIAVLVRPGNMVVFPVSAALLVVLFAQIRSRLVVMTAILAISLMIALKATPLVYMALYHSSEGGSPASRDLMQKVMFAKGGDEGGPPHACDTEIMERVLAPARDYIAKAPSFAQSYLEQRYGDFIKYRYLLPEVAKRHGYEAAWRGDPIFMCQAKYRLSKHFGYYVSSVFHAYLGLASYAPQVPFSQVNAYNAFIAQNPPPPLPEVADPPADQELDRKGQALTGVSLAVPPRAQAYLTLGGKGSNIFHMLMSAAALTLNFFPLAALAAAWRKWGGGVLLDEKALCGGLLFVAVQAVALLTAALEFGLPRYIQPLWPLSLAACILTSAVFAFGRSVRLS